MRPTFLNLHEFSHFLIKFLVHRVVGDCAMCSADAIHPIVTPRRFASCCLFIRTVILSELIYR